HENYHQSILGVLRSHHLLHHIHPLHQYHHHHRHPPKTTLCRLVRHLPSPLAFLTVRPQRLVPSQGQSWQVTYLTPVLAYENWVGRSGDGRLLVAVIRLMIPALHTLKKVGTRPDRVDNLVGMTWV